MTHTEALETGATERYLLDEMNEAERQAFEAHFFDCTDCAEDVRAASRLRDGAAAGMTRAVSAAAARPRRAYDYVGWALAASLAIVAGYQAVVLRERQGISMQALDPVTLRGATRGPAPVLPVPAGATVVTIALPIDVPAGTPLTYELVAAGSRTVASSHAVAPMPGAPLLVLLPAPTLSPGTQYTLAVHRADGARVDQFEFVTASR